LNDLTSSQINLVVKRSLSCDILKKIPLLFIKCSTGNQSFQLKKWNMLISLGLSNLKPCLFGFP
jgi:hypothetical protein